MAYLRFSMLFFAITAFASDPVPEKLSIQNGDSLSTISGTLFGDGTYWPKVWKANSKLTNPHLIDAGDSIQFLLGGEDAPPAFSISEADDVPDISEPPSLRPAAGRAASDVIIPAPAVKPKPVLMELPSSFPQYQSLRRAKVNFKDYDVDILPRPRVNSDAPVVIPVYAQDSKIESIGQYESSVGEQGLAFDGQEVFIKLKKGTGQLGSHYVMVRDWGELAQSPFSSRGKYTGGHAIEVLAEVVLESDAEADAESDWQHYRARILHAVGLTIKDSAIIAGRLNTISLSRSGPISELNADIIGGNYDNKGSIFGDGNWVFLDKGAKDGVMIGQMVWAYTNPQSRDENSPFKVGVKHAALIKIGSTANSVSTGVVIASSETMMQGDGLGTPGMPAVDSKKIDDTKINDEMENDSGSDPAADTSMDELE